MMMTLREIDNSISDHMQSYLDGSKKMAIDNVIHLLTEEVGYKKTRKCVKEAWYELNKDQVLGNVRYDDKGTTEVNFPTSWESDWHPAAPLNTSYEYEMCEIVEVRMTEVNWQDWIDTPTQTPLIDLVLKLNGEVIGKRFRLHDALKYLQNDNHQLPEITNE